METIKRTRPQVKVLLVLSFVAIVAGHSLHPYLWDSAFYHLTAFCFATLTRIIWVRSVGKWKIVSLVMHVTTLNNLMDELFFDPKVMDYNEYITFIISILVIYRTRHKWNK